MEKRAKVALVNLPAVVEIHALLHKR